MAEQNIAKEPPESKFGKFIRNTRLFDSSRDEGRVQPGVFTALGVALEGMGEARSGKTITAFDRFMKRFGNDKSINLNNATDFIDAFNKMQGGGELPGGTPTGASTISAGGEFIPPAFKRPTMGQVFDEGLPPNPQQQYELSLGKNGQPEVTQTPVSEGAREGVKKGTEESFKSFYSRDQKVLDKQYESKVAALSDVEKKQLKTLEDKFGQAGRFIQAVRNLHGFGKAVDEDIDVPEAFSGYTGAYKAGATAVGGLPIASDKLQIDTKSGQSYIAQLEESKIAAVPILSGQARYVVDLANAIARTMPDLSRVTELRGDLISQSVRNMMALNYGVQNGFFTRDNLSEQGIDIDSVNDIGPGQAGALLNAVQLSEDQEQAIEEAIDYVMDTPAIRGGKISNKRNLDEVEVSDFSDLSDEELQEIMGGK